MLLWWFLFPLVVVFAREAPYITSISPALWKCDAPCSTNLSFTFSGYHFAPNPSVPLFYMYSARLPVLCQVDAGARPSDTQLSCHFPFAAVDWDRTLPEDPSTVALFAQVCSEGEDWCSAQSLLGFIRVPVKGRRWWVVLLIVSAILLPILLLGWCLEKERVRRSTTVVEDRLLSHGSFPIKRDGVGQPSNLDQVSS